MNRRALLLVICVTASCAVEPAKPAGSPANAAPLAAPAAGGHRYQLIAHPGIPFEKAEAEAAALNGHLVRLETATYADELKAVHDAVFGPTVRDDKWYWIGASRPTPQGSPQEGWRWNDGAAVPPSITSTWNIDMMEGAVPEGACAHLDRQVMRVGDYSAVNPTGIVDGYLVELE